MPCCCTGEEPTAHNSRQSSDQEMAGRMQPLWRLCSQPGNYIVTSLTHTIGERQAVAWKNSLVFVSARINLVVWVHGPLLLPAFAGSQSTETAHKSEQMWPHSPFTNMIGMGKGSKYMSPEIWHIESKEVFTCYCEAEALWFSFY